jgi:simple sugar transport system ATP-binding protein
MTSPQPAVVEMTGADKRFGSTVALSGVDLTLHAGQCVGLVGRNGAGKSTVVSILSGMETPDAGTVRFAGRPAPRVGDVTRWREWIATVFQHSMVVPALSVAENVFLGGTERFVSWRDMRARTREVMADWGYDDIKAEALCRDLTVEQRQIVEIARALARGARCVLLDEPTAALERDAARRLFARVRQLTSGGVAVLYISHHLEEVFEICDEVRVLRDGRLVLAAPTAQLSKNDIVAAMVGDAGAAGVPAEATDAARERAAGAGDEPVLDVVDLTAESTRGRVIRVSLQVRPGEVVGVTGLLSAGVATIGRVIAGDERHDGGQIRLHGRLIPAGSRAAAQRAGIGYVPEDRRAEGFVAQLGVAENVTMAIAGRLADQLGFLRPGRRAAAATPITASLSLVSTGPGQPVSELSGGNQQKVTVARTLAHEPTLIVAITPTRGVDVASKSLLLDSLAAIAKHDGAGVLLCSDELSDLVICNRVIVLVRGEVFTEFSHPPFDRDQLIVATEGIAADGRPEEEAE